MLTCYVSGAYVCMMYPGVFKSPTLHPVHGLMVSQLAYLLVTALIFFFFFLRHFETLI